MSRCLRPTLTSWIVVAFVGLSCAEAPAPSSSGSGGSEGPGSATGGAVAASGGGLGIGGSSGGGTPSGGTSSSGGSAPSGGAGGQGAATGGAATGGAASGGSSSGGSIAADVPITIWLAGDSTMANGNTPCPSGWGKHFQDEFNELVTVVNSAAGGRSVRTWLYSVTTTMGSDGECVVEATDGGDPLPQARWADMQAALGEGDYLFIQFGINDGSATCDRHVGIERFKQEYAMMAEVARSQGTNPVFVTPVSAIACNGSTAIGTRGDYVTATLDVGEDNGVPVIDLHQLSIDLYGELAFCPVAGGDVSASTGGPVGEFFCDDHTHFSDAGSISIGALMARAIADLGLPLAGYLK